MERYNEYKDSGVQWLGEIPGHWGLRKMKYTFSERSQKGFPNEPLLAATQNHGVIKKSDYENRTVEATKNLDTLKLVEKGDFVISLRSFQGGIEYSYCRGIISPAYTVLKAHHLTEPYFKHLAKSPIFIDLLKSTVTGIREGQNIDYIKLKVEFLPIPTIEEQQAIASYLDTSTAKIDEAIAQQQRMIDLLNERKQIIINNAVTKGLNPDAPMKDSGVDWIGEIPEHWICCSFRNIIDVLTDYTANGSFGDLAKNVNYQSEGYARLVRLTDLRENLENENGVWVDKHGYEYLSKSTLYGGELLMANVGAYSGLPCVMPKVDYLTTLAPNMFLIKQDVSKADTPFLFYLLSSYDYFNWLQTIALASAQPKLNKENIRSLQILLPPRVEQEKIVRHIQDKIKPLELAISVAKQQISLLQERKQIIINDVVTGKVKVC